MIRPRLIKWLAALCVLECVGAATSPSSPAPKLGAAMIDGGEGPGSGEGSPLPTCGCSDELEAMAAELEGAAVLHAAELEGVRGEFEVKLEGVRGEFEVKFEGIHQFLSMTPPSSPPSSPPPPSPPQMRDCAASPCTDSYWLNGIGARERHVRQTEKHSDRLKKWMSTARRTLDCPPHTGHLTARTRVTTDRTWLRLVGPCTVSGQVHRRRVGLSRVSRVSRVRVWRVSRVRE